MSQQSLVRDPACGRSGSLFRGCARPGSYSKAWLLAIALLALASYGAYAEGFSASQKAEIQAIIKEYLLQKPEILREAIGVLEARDADAVAKERVKIVSDPGSALFSPAHQAVVGTPLGKITVVEFFDYNCGY
jgi:protein-disulfide isomerase